MYGKSRRADLRSNINFERPARCVQRCGTAEFVSTFNGTLEDFATDTDCVGTNTLSANGCELTSHATNCPIKDAAGRRTGTDQFDGVVHIVSSTKMTGTATYNFAFADGSSCISTFDLTGVRK
jgi:hypothetical protein